MSTKLLSNEDGVSYSYPADQQEADFPNDDHTPYATEAEADAASVIRVAEMADLKKAHAGSFYFIAGAGGDLSEWVSGYEEMLEEQGIGKPTEWLSASGAAVNLFANQKKGRIVSQRPVPARHHLPAVPAHRAEHGEVAPVQTPHGGPLVR